MSDEPPTIRRKSLDPSFSQSVPDGDDRLRRVCDHCAFVDYENPKIVVGSVAVHEGAILLCKRAIEPRKGFWTLPAGYLETGESVEAGARREAYEEARVDLRLDRVLAIYSIPRIAQVQIMFRAALARPDYAPGPESEAVDLFAWADIPWSDIAFPTVGWALRHYHETKGRTDFPVFSNPADGL